MELARKELARTKTELALREAEVLRMQAEVTRRESARAIVELEDVDFSEVFELENNEVVPSVYEGKEIK